MADNQENRAPRNAARISLSEAHELRYWTKTFGVSSDMLLTAVRAVGPEAARVREYLEAHGGSRPPESREENRGDEAVA